MVRIKSQLGSIGNPDTWLHDLMQPPSEDQFVKGIVRRSLMTPEQEVMSLPENARMKRMDQVLLLTKEGKTEAEIAKELGIQEKTIYWYGGEAVKKGLVTRNPFAKTAETPNVDTPVTKETVPVTEKTVPVTDTLLKMPEEQAQRLREKLNVAPRKVAKDLLIGYLESAGLAETVSALHDLMEDLDTYRLAEHDITGRLGEKTAVRDAIIDESVLLVERWYKSLEV